MHFLGLSLSMNLVTLAFVVYTNIQLQFKYNWPHIKIFDLINVTNA